MKRKLQIILTAFYLCFSITMFSRLGFCSTFTDFMDKGYRASNFDQKIKFYTQAIEKWTPQDGLTGKVEAYLNRGRAYSENGLYDLAIKDCTDAIKLDPKYGDAYYNRSLAYKKKGNIIKALLDLAKAKSLR